MMFKKVILLGITAGLLAAIASLIYTDVYQSSLGGDFSRLVNVGTVLPATLLAGVVAGVGYFLLDKWLPRWGELIFNLVFVVLSFASIVIPFGATLPLDIDYPELFPGLTVPMHFFPALAWLTLKPLFIRQGNRY